MRQRTHVSGPTRLRGASPRRLLHLILVMALAMVSVAAAQRVALGLLSIVVNPVPSFEVDVFLDRAGGGNQAPLYRVGEPIRVGVGVSSSTWVYLFDVGADGRITQILPNRYDDAGLDNFVTAGETKYFPPRNARYEFLVDGPNGLSKVFAVASKDRLDTRQLAQFRSDESFAQSDLDDLYGSLHRQLRDQGWSLRDRERNGESVEAEYRRNGETIELEIEGGDWDRLELEIELEDEND